MLRATAGLYRSSELEWVVSTIECLESVFRLNYPHFTVIVCDNASSDGSMKKIEGWANGFIAASCDSEDLVRLTVPPITKPLDYILSSGEAAKSGSSSSRLLLDSDWRQPRFCRRKQCRHSICPCTW